MKLARSSDLALPLTRFYDLSYLHALDSAIEQTLDQQLTRAGTKDERQREQPALHGLGPLLVVPGASAAQRSRSSRSQLSSLPSS